MRVRRGSPGRELLLHDLAASRREAAALGRENDRLRAQLKIGETRTGARGPRDDRFAGGPVRCRRCGRSLELASMQRDETLVLASCCPWCDGPLVGVGTTGQPDPDPSVFLG